MERAIALKKLTKLLGRKMGWRLDPKAPSADERAEAQAALPAAVLKRDEVRAKRDARYRALLDGDAEYRRLVTEHNASRTEVDRLLTMTRWYKITVVQPVGGLFNRVIAEGDSWEQVIAKVEAQR